MLVGVPREIKDNEYRVGIVPSTVRELADKGHQVVIETQAGAGAGFVDADYQSAGAEIVPNGDAVFGRSELIVKVKEPLAAERKKLSRGQVLFTYLHLAPDRAQTEELMASGVTAIAYETVTSQQGTLPLLMPMSEVAGRMAPQVGAHYLEKQNGGRGENGARHRVRFLHRNPHSESGPHLLGWFMLAATIIPLTDAGIVLGHGGTKGTAYGIHGVTAGVMLKVSGILLLG